LQGIVSIIDQNSLGKPQLDV